MKHCNQSSCRLSALSVELALQTPPSWTDELTRAASSVCPQPGSWAVAAKGKGDTQGIKIAVSTNPLQASKGHACGQDFITALQILPFSMLRCMRLLGIMQ